MGLRAIQAGILICLMAITGLLFGIYQQRQMAVVAPASELAEMEPIEEPAVVEAEVPAPLAERAYAAPLPRVAPEPKPSPAARQTRVNKPAPQPEPASVVADEPRAVEPVEPIEPAEPSKAEIVMDEAPVVTEPVRAATDILMPLHEETPAEPRTPRVVTIPEGQRLTVRLDNTLSTSRSRPDDSFFVTLDEPLIVDGLVLADKGARLEGRVVESVQAGRVKGQARLELELARLRTDDGQNVEIRTSMYGIDGPRGRNEDLKKVAMGAGAGAVLGAIFGGGKGAAIGAASGAGAGAGAAAVTRGEPAMLEPETRLEFRLAEPVTITEQF